MSLLGTIFTVIGISTTIIISIRIFNFINFYFLSPSKLDQYLVTPSGKKPYAVVTGASDGIGLELSRQLLERGFNVLLHGRNPEKLNRIATSLRDDFPTQDVRIVVANATEAYTSAKKVVAAIQEIESEDGILKVLVNNIGGSVVSSRAYQFLDEKTSEDIDKTFAMNAVFPTELTRLLLSTLTHHQPALIINLGSAAGINGMPYIPLYGGCKAYNHRFSESLANEMAMKGIKVEVLGIVIGDVVSGTNTVTQASFTTLTSREMARSILCRVGCGRTEMVVGSWRQAIVLSVTTVLPKKVLWGALRDEMQRRRREEDVEVEKRR